MHVRRQKIWSESTDLCEIADDFRAGINRRCPSVRLREQDMACEPESKLYHPA